MTSTVKFARMIVLALMTAGCAGPPKPAPLPPPSAYVPVFVKQTTTKVWVPTWDKEHRIYLDRNPTYFAYVDNMQEGSSAEAIATSNKEIHQTFVQNGFICESRQVLRGGKNIASYPALPSSRSHFTVSCQGECKDVKYSIATGTPTYVYHAGLANPFPYFVILGAKNMSIDFTFFNDGQGAARDMLMTGKGSQSLKDNTRITISLWYHKLLPYGTDCE